MVCTLKITDCVPEVPGILWQPLWDVEQKVNLANASITIALLLFAYTLGI